MTIIKNKTLARRVWNKRRSEKLLKKRTIRLEKIKNRRNRNDGLLDIVTIEKRPSYPKKGKNAKRFIVPKEFSIERNIKETLRFFSKIINFIGVSNPYRGVYFDSSKVKYVTESTLMYLFAIISDVRCADYIIRGNHPRNESIKRVYQNCGFDKLLNKDEFSYTVLDNGNALLIRGKTVSSNVGRNVSDFLQSATGISDTNRGIFYAALIEMMSNTSQHAYLKDDKLEKKWQIFMQKKNGVVNFVFLDTGQGIPATVSRTYKEKAKVLYEPEDIKDSDLLKSAFEGEDRSRTEQKNRGRGLPQIYILMNSNFVKHSAVFSGKAIMAIALPNDKIYYNLDDSFYGTLYEFTFQGV